MPFFSWKDIFVTVQVQEWTWNFHDFVGPTCNLQTRYVSGFFWIRMGEVDRTTRGPHQDLEQQFPKLFCSRNVSSRHIGVEGWNIESSCLPFAQKNIFVSTENYENVSVTILDWCFHNLTGHRHSPKGANWLGSVPKNPWSHEICDEIRSASFPLPIKTLHDSWFSFLG